MKSRPLMQSKITVICSANVDFVICTDPLGKGTTRSMAQYDEIVKYLINRFADAFAYGHEDGNMVVKMN